MDRVLRTLVFTPAKGPVTLIVARGERSSRTVRGEPRPGWAMPSTRMFLADDTGDGTCRVDGIDGAGTWAPIFNFRDDSPSPEELRPVAFVALGIAESIDAIVGRTVVAQTAHGEVRFVVGSVSYEPHRDGTSFDLQFFEDRATYEEPNGKHVTLRIWYSGQMSLNLRLVEGPLADTFRLLD